MTQRTQDTPRNRRSRPTNTRGTGSSARAAGQQGKQAGSATAAASSGGQEDHTSAYASSTPGPPAVESFAELDLPAPLLEALKNEGLTSPFPIQAATLPSSLAGRDVLGRGRTGSGKTLAFGLALLARTAGQRAESRRPLALVLVPTRELAQQVTDALSPYARPLQLRIATVVGGVSVPRQARALRDGAEVLVATPGRLKDLIERGDCALGDVRTSVLDEADQMADMGFLPQVTALLKQVPGDGQRMLFSATLDRDVDRLVRRFLTDPVQHSVDPPAGAVTEMRHHVLHVSNEDKAAATVRIGAREGRVLMFRATKRAVDRLTKDLLSKGVRAAALHGGRSQPQRTRALEGFKTGDITVLVATDIAARGIHIDDLDLVVNVDPPNDHKDYLHRGGRTARAGASGSVVTLVLPEQRREMSRLMSQARVDALTSTVRPDDQELARLTGAREPSGIPVVLTPAAPPAGGGGGAARGTAPKRSRGRRGGGGRGGGGNGGGGGAGNTARGAAAASTNARRPRRSSPPRGRAS
ncbi:DEAD/DEAH box helicase [Streptomyces iconiensis]|uniref:DEAD/DEAH box helicase n=1 Tax=Streptomyces iconiensis TaxID=1384038 RepID=A0ABT6ZPN2_9ACTN|nr:DEAD/DEAH box helicase [Streptomyces iconiensis]MDJ1131012.1 DEAD/DEAH box helicase [Streptomyces iconiensis]